MRKHFRRSRKRLVRYSLLTANLVLLLIVVVFVSNGPASVDSKQSLALNAANETVATNPLDKLSSADIAVQVARMTNIGEVSDVANHANKVNIELAVAVSVDDSLVSKPQIIDTELKSVADIQTHVVKEGDTLSSLAKKFGVTSDSIRWSNGLIGDDFSVGSKIVIPPIDGIVYRVQAGDTAESLAQHYGSNAGRIIAFNDAEINGLKVGQRIVIPGGEEPSRAYSNITYSTFRPSYNADWNYITHYTSYTPYPVGSYGRGWCTDWAAYRSAQLGNPVGNWGNAIEWAGNARGYYVGSRPKVGAIVYFHMGGWGHVGVVEEVSADGTKIKFSDMNGLAGWGNAAKTKDWVNASNYSYIYR